MNISPLRGAGRNIGPSSPDQNRNLMRILARGLAVVALAASLAACRSSGDVTGSIGSAGASASRIPALAAQYDRAPENKTVAMTYAQALRAGGRATEAAAVLQRVAARYPMDRQILGAYGKALAETGRLKEAATVLKGAHTPERPDWSVLSAQGSVADQMGDHKGAQVFYQSSLRIAPGEPAVLSNLGLSYALSRNLPEAEQALRQANAHPRADARVRHNLALVLALQGNFKEAEQIQLKDMPPDQAAANVAAIRQMIAQSNTWRDIERQGTPRKPAARPKPQAAL
jgi:Flp pilus assembly protein TadD